MNAALWDHWLSCHTPLSQCPRCDHVRRELRTLRRRCPLTIIANRKAHCDQAI